MADITVTVSDGHLDSIEAVAAELRDNGMEVRQVLGRVGVISGSVSDERRHALESVDGVEAVEDESTFQLPPPGSSVQ